MKFTPDNITYLEPNQIFVFGSNDNGWHGAGAARHAFENFGAEYHTGQGPTGQCYAIPTKSHEMKTKRLVDIANSVYHFLEYARLYPHLEFLVTKIGCGLAGLQPHDVGRLFVNAPDNVILPKEFYESIQTHRLK